MNKEELNRKLRKSRSFFKKDSTIKSCFHHCKEDCEGKIKQSHSIQRNGRLSIIEDEVNGNNCIYTFTSFKSSEHRLIENLVPIGKKEASTFFGFCDYHDTNLFAPIENNKFDGSDKHLFLHSYRSYAHSYHRKLEEQKVYNDPDSEFIKQLNKFQVLQMKKGIELGIKDSMKHKEQIDNALDKNDYLFFEYLVYEKEGLYPFAVSSQLSPRVTYQNIPMNNHMYEDVAWSQPILTFLPDQTSTFVIIAAFPDDEKAIMLIDELNELSDHKLEKAITSLIIANCENTFFSPKFWNHLSKKHQKELLYEFEINSTEEHYVNNFFHSSFNFFSSSYKMSNLK